MRFNISVILCERERRSLFCFLPAGDMISSLRTMQELLGLIHFIYAFVIFTSSTLLLFCGSFHVHPHTRSPYRLPQRSEIKSFQFKRFLVFASSLQSWGRDPKERHVFFCKAPKSKLQKVGWTMEKNETGCQPAVEAPTLCVNKCGFFGTPATMNVCLKCHKDSILKQQQAKLAASAIESIVNGNSINKVSVIFSQSSMVQPVSAGSEAALSTQPSSAPQVEAESSEKANEGQGQSLGPSRCTTCRKRVGLTGFNCRCGNVFCSVHRYSDKHDCQFDYRTSAKDEISQIEPGGEGRKA